MVDQKQQGPNGNDWQMPEPVFKSTEGKKPGAPAGLLSAEDDIPTEPGFRQGVSMATENKDAASATRDADGHNALEKNERGKNLSASMTLVFIVFALLVL